jgi:hypothetical protein
MMPMMTPPASASASAPATPALKARQWNEVPPNQLALSHMPVYPQAYPQAYPQVQAANQGRQQEAPQTPPGRKVVSAELLEPAYRSPQQRFEHPPYGKPLSSVFF